MGARTRRAIALSLGALLVLSLGGARPARADPPPPAGPPVPVSADERVSYWLDRLMLGAEETTWQAPNFYQLLLADAAQNLAVLGDATLDRLDDPKFQEKVQLNPDANAWHAVLSVLGLMAAPRVETVRAWAIPALGSPLYTLRRAATPVIAQVGHPADAPILLAQLKRDTGDGFIAGNLSKILLQMGPPWDGEAVRALHDLAVADQSGHTSGHWGQVLTFAAMAPNGARSDLLAWWGLLAETSGPRPRDPPRSAGRESAAVDPNALRVVSVDHATTTGRYAAALARADLAKMEFRGPRAWLEADLRSGDPVLAGLARERLGLRADPAQRERLRGKVERLVRTLETVNVRPGAALAAFTGEPAPAAPEAEVRDGDIPPVTTVAALISALGEDDSPEALDLLRRFLFVPVQTRAWAAALRNAYLVLERRGGEPERQVEAMLLSGESELTSRGLSLVRDSKSPAYVLTLEAWLERPEAAPWRFEVRRLLVYLYVSAITRGGVAGDRVAAFARRVAEWASDPKDPSASSLAAALLDLGPPGEAQFVEGLGGPQRAAFVSALTFRPRRYLGPDLVDALLRPVRRDTSLSERRAALTAALAVASSASISSFDALVQRLGPDERPDAEWVRRIVRHRAPSF